MDIDCLSKMVKDLLLDNDRVALPGFGSFVAELAPSVFSDRGYTINPPYRKLSFRENAGADDMLLVRHYAAEAGMPEDKARDELIGFISGLREVLNRQKTVIFPELGRLRATRENNYFFVSDEDMDIFPDGVGLEPVSLKAHVAPAETAAVQPGSGKSKPSKALKAGIAVAVVIAVAAIALGIFVLLAHLCPDFIDSILYTEEELRLLGS